MTEGLSDQAWDAIHDALTSKEREAFYAMLSQKDALNAALTWENGRLREKITLIIYADQQGQVAPSREAAMKLRKRIHEARLALSPSKNEKGDGK